MLSWTEMVLFRSKTYLLVKIKALGVGKVLALALSKVWMGVVKNPKAKISHTQCQQVISTIAWKLFPKRLSQKIRSKKPWSVKPSMKQIKSWLISEMTKIIKITTRSLKVRVEVLLIKWLNLKKAKKTVRKPLSGRSKSARIFHKATRVKT